MDHEYSDLLALLLPHKLTLQVYQLRSAIWRSSKDISACALVPCVPLAGLPPYVETPRNLSWAYKDLSFRQSPALADSMTILPWNQNDATDSLLQQIPDKTATYGKGIYLGSKEVYEAACSIEYPLSLLFNDARLARIRVREHDNGWIWSILEERHLISI